MREITLQWQWQCTYSKQLVVRWFIILLSTIWATTQTLAPTNTLPRARLLLLIVVVVVVWALVCVCICLSLSLSLSLNLNLNLNLSLLLPLLSLQLLFLLSTPLFFPCPHSLLPPLLLITTTQPNSACDLSPDNNCFSHRKVNQNEPFWDSYQTSNWAPQKWLNSQHFLARERVTFLLTCHYPSQRNRDSLLVSKQRSRLHWVDESSRLRSLISSFTVSSLRNDH